MKLLSIRVAHDGKHKFVATYKLDNGRQKHIRFGAVGYEDYTIHKDPMRKKRYIIRHKDRETWYGKDAPLTPGCLSRWILWNKRTLQASISDFKKRFKL
jgi:hypothetical protein